MNKSRILIFLLAILMIVSISAVSAADIADSDDLSQVQDDSTPLKVDEATDDVQANDESTQSAETGDDLAPLQASIDDKGADELSVDKDVEKLSKSNSSVKINPIDNVTYGEPVVVNYTIENRSSNVTVSICYDDGDIQPPVEGVLYETGEKNVTITNLTAGKYVIFIYNNEDDNYNKSSTGAFFSVTKATPMFDVKAYVDEHGMILVNVTTNKTATGKVGFKIDDSDVMPYDIIDGTVEFGELTVYPKGTHNVTVIYKGDDNYKNASYNTTVDVTKDVPVIDIQSAVVDQFGAIVVNANITKGATENVTFLFINHDTDKNFTVEIPIGENGTIEYDELEPFAKGYYSVQIGYAGDANYYAIAENAQTEVNVTKTAPVIENMTVVVNEYGHIVVNANITKGATGNVTFLFINTDTGKNMTVPIEIGANGTIEYDELTPFDKGHYNVQIGYAGDANYYPIPEYVQADINVTKIVPAMNYTVNVVGGEVTIAVTLPSDINGNLTVIYPSGYMQNVTVKNGTASITYVAMNETGDLAINVLFAGNDKYYADEAIIGFTIKQATFVKASSVSVVYQNNAKVTVKLTNLVTNKTIAGANVEITINGKTYKGTTNKDGNVVITIPANMLPKKYTANLVYKGNETLESDVDEFAFTVKKATPKVTAKKKTFKKSVKVKKYTITLKDNKGKAIKKAKVTIKVGKKTFKATTNAKGKAVFKLKKLTKKAKYNAKVTYKGNSYFNKVTKKVKITIK